MYGIPAHTAVAQDGPGDQILRERPRDQILKAAPRNRPLRKGVSTKSGPGYCWPLVLGAGAPQLPFVGITCARIHLPEMQRYGAVSSGVDDAYSQHFESSIFARRPACDLTSALATSTPKAPECWNRVATFRRSQEAQRPSKFCEPICDAKASKTSMQQAWMPVPQTTTTILGGLRDGEDESKRKGLQC